MTTERQTAIALAHRTLTNPIADPDDDMMILSRQLLRAQETLDRLKLERDHYDPMRDVIDSNRDALLRKNEEAVYLIRQALDIHNNPRLYIVTVLDALSLFHPMHPESWAGFPELPKEIQTP